MAKTKAQRRAARQKRKTRKARERTEHARERVEAKAQASWGTTIASGPDAAGSSSLFQRVELGDVRTDASPLVATITGTPTELTDEDLAGIRRAVNKGASLGKSITLPLLDLVRRLRRRLDQRDKEWLLCAAILVHFEGEVLTFAGYRHADCLHNARVIYRHLTGERQEAYRLALQRCEQGFLSSGNRFFDRPQAAVLATKAGQLVQGPTNYLTSEDLY